MKPHGSAGQTPFAGASSFQNTAPITACPMVETAALLFSAQKYPMENLMKLKSSVLAGRDCREMVEACYKDFLDSFSTVEATVFLSLLEMASKTPRIEEILKVMDFVRFPVKKFVGSE